MEIMEIIEKYGVILYFFVILLGGRYGTRIVPSRFIKSKFIRFNIFATLFAILFNVFESLADQFEVTKLVNYLFTYLMASFIYDKYGDKIPFLKDDNTTT